MVRWSSFADICSISLWRSVIPVKTGVSWAVLTFGGDSVESLVRPSFISGSSVRKFRHSSHCAAVNSLRISLSSS